MHTVTCYIRKSISVSMKKFWYLIIVKEIWTEMHFVYLAYNTSRPIKPLFWPCKQGAAAAHVFCVFFLWIIKN